MDHIRLGCFEMRNVLRRFKDRHTWSTDATAIARLRLHQTNRLCNVDFCALGRANLSLANFVIFDTDGMRCYNDL